jgi:O-antigen/teichoic acid export membrane protein
LANRRVPSEMLWVMSGIIISTAITLGGTRFLTTFLSRTEYGSLVLMVSFAGFFDQVIGHAIGGASMRYYSIFKLEGQLGVLRKIIFRYLLASIVVYVFGVILIGLLKLPSINILLILTFVFSIARLVSGIGLRLAEGARRRKVSAVFRSSFELMRFGLAAFFIYFTSATAESAMSGFMIGAGVVACAHWYYIRFNLLNDIKQIKKEEQSQQNQSIKSFGQYTWPLLMVGFGNWVFLMSPLWTIGWFCEVAEAGGYAAFHQLAFIPMLVISGVLLTFLAPIVYDATLVSPEKAMKNSFKLTRITLFSVAIIAIIAYLGHQSIAKLLLGEHFRSNSWMFPWLIIAGGVYGVAQQLLLKFRAEMKTFKLAVIQLTFALAALIFYSLAAKYFSVEGVVYGVTILNIFLLLIAFLFAKAPPKIQPFSTQ